MTHTDVANSAAIHAAVEAERDNIISFLRELCAIPSMDSQIGPVGERVQAEMKKLGFDECWFDSMGNTLGKIGSGDKILLYSDGVEPLIGE